LLVENKPKNSLDDFFKKAYRSPRHQASEENWLFSKLWLIPNVAAAFAFGLYADSVEKIAEPGFLENVGIAILPAALSSLYSLTIGKSHEETLAHYPLVVTATLTGMYANPIYNFLLEHIQ